MMGDRYRGPRRMASTGNQLPETGLCLPIDQR
jgi:hypothetical protein